MNYVKEGHAYLCFLQAPSEHSAAGYHRKRVGLNHLAFTGASRALAREFLHVVSVQAAMAGDERAYFRFNDGESRMEARASSAVSPLYLLERSEVGIVQLDANRHVVGMNDFARRVLPVDETQPFERFVLSFHPERSQLACGALLEAPERGVPVPQRLALLGFGDFCHCAPAQPGAVQSPAAPPRHRRRNGAFAARRPASRQARSAGLAALGSGRPWQHGTGRRHRPRMMHPMRPPDPRAPHGAGFALRRA